MGNLHLNSDGVFVIKNYNQQKPFSNFLPAVAGKWGIPLWAFYVNRGQGIVSFGVSDKDHSIAEFYPADRAYRVASTLGFRTFIKINKKKVYEPFVQISGFSKKENMYISSHDLRIEEINKTLNLKFSVRYFTIPNFGFPALVRVLDIENLSSKKVELEVLDGLPRVIPFGTRDIFLKFLSRTLEAWMYSYLDSSMATFKLLVDPEDVAKTKLIKGSNFNCAFYKDKTLERPKYIVDPYEVFKDDTSFKLPHQFLSDNFSYPKTQVKCGRTPCSFSNFKWQLKAKEIKSFYSLWGQVQDPEILKSVKKVNIDFIGLKEKENKNLIEKIKDNVLCVSGLDSFNQYLRSTYLDNVLRGGFPFSRNGNKAYYIFSRKHGDLERDYNKFKILASPFSEGESNYRDVNQNRRMDLFFNPSIGTSSIVYFLNLIKIDGYNPLVVKGEKLYFDNNQEIDSLFRQFKIKKDEKLLKMIRDGFYLGELFITLENKGIKINEKDKFLDYVLLNAKREPCADFAEGYWIDHWRYNLDLIESFLYFYPDKIKKLFLNTQFMFWDGQHRIKPRKFKYVLRDGKVYQANSVEGVPKKEELIKHRRRFKNFLRVDDGKGKIYTVNLFTKLLSLVLNKTSSLDPDGMGIEMEADKPGWCDSLNGLPALFGSSLCETLELARAAKLMLRAIESLDNKAKIDLGQELYIFFKDLNRLLINYFSSRSKRKDYVWWDESNNIKEKFRESTFMGVSGKKKEIGLKDLKAFLILLVDKLNIGIKKAKDKKSGLYHSYFFYDVKEYSVLMGGIVWPKLFARRNLALFLESAVHAMRVKPDQTMINNLRKSELFDKKLKMYKLNASLKSESLEIGRSRVFPPGWLENESIWLHMEYKYILELLKNGFYDDFYKDFLSCCVCFFKPEVYGRSILENSSFIVSSEHPDKTYWGRGFVARLTGATVELINIWILMCLGNNPFVLDKEGKINMQFSPILKKDFFTNKATNIVFEGKKEEIPANSFAFKLFSSTLVVYHNPKRSDTFNLKVKKIIVATRQKKYNINSSLVDSFLSYKIRERKVRRIDVYLG